jgi:hypothetical protein
MESTLAQISSSPLVTGYAQDRSHKTLKKTGMFIAPFCQVASARFHYKVYDARARFRRSNTKFNVQGQVTQLNFGGTDVYQELVPHALDLPMRDLTSFDAFTDQEVSWMMMEGIDVLSDASALDLEAEQINLATNGVAVANEWALDYTAGGLDSTYDPINDPNYGLDQAVRTVKLAAPGLPIRIAVGNGAFLDAKRNSNIRSKFIVGDPDGSVGAYSLSERQLSSLIMGSPELMCADMVEDSSPIGTVAANANSTPGMSAPLDFILDHEILVFACNPTPNRMDASFMKTFAPFSGFFKPGTYTRPDGRGQVAKMDWITLPLVTNPTAAVRIKTNTGTP